MKKKIRTEMAVNKLFGGNFESIDEVWDYLYCDLIENEDKWSVGHNVVDVESFRFLRYFFPDTSPNPPLVICNSELKGMNYILWMPGKVHITSIRLTRLLRRLDRKYTRKANNAKKEKKKAILALELAQREEEEERIALEAIADINQYFQDQGRIVRRR